MGGPPQAAGTDEAASLPLAGVRVLDCSRVLAGPFATMLLGDLGADVWKLEPPLGDESRGWGPPFWGDPADRRSAYFAAVNRNKRSLVVDLKTVAGRRLLGRLLSTADILVHNYATSVATRLGMDQRRLAAEHPGLVVAVVGGFPADERPAYDLLAQAVSGFMAVTGEPDGEPMKAGVPVLDLLTGLETAVAALAGLYGARTSAHPAASQGAVVAREGPAPARFDIGLVETGVASLTNVLAGYLASGLEPSRLGNAHPNVAPYQAFAARDGHLVIACGNDAQFGRLLDVLGLPADDRFATNADRVRGRESLIPILEAVIATRGRDELLGALAEASVPAGPVRGVGDALAAIRRDSGGDWTQQIGGMELAPSPIWLAGARLPVRQAPPLLGEHTDSLLAELGLAADEIERLRTEGVVIG
jgi:crotonobetainyl-CoA:carnitine CoA-transferase CaiB-like acyl-CoA transferase